MGKHINIIARTNGVGLDSDAQLLQTALESLGYKVTFSHCRSKTLFASLLAKLSHQQLEFDANIFLERTFLAWLSAAPINILIPNQERYPKRQLSRLKHIDHLFCKSQHAQKIFSALSTKYRFTCHFTGFTSKDVHLNDQIRDYQTFFHLAGRSTLKGTETILKLWQNNPHWPNLTIVQNQANAPDSVPENVTLIAEHLPYAKLNKLVNSKSIHLCTSRSEGWGHYIVEAMSAQAVVITTDAPPMNELISPNRGILVPYSQSEPRHLGTNFYVNESQLEQAIETIINLNTADKQAIGLASRDWFLDNYQQFLTSLDSTLQSIFTSSQSVEQTIP